MPALENGEQKVVESGGGEGKAGGDIIAYLSGEEGRESNPVAQGIAVIVVAVASFL